MSISYDINSHNANVDKINKDNSWYVDLRFETQFLPFKNYQYSDECPMFCYFIIKFRLYFITGGNAGLGSAGPSSTSVAKYIAGKDEQV